MRIKVIQLLINMYYYLIPLTGIYPNLWCYKFVQVGCLSECFPSEKHFKWGPPLCLHCTFLVQSLTNFTALPNCSGLFGRVSPRTVNNCVTYKVAFSCLKCLKSSILPCSQNQSSSYGTQGPLQSGFTCS